MSNIPSAEQMAFEIDVANGLKSLYGTNQPGKTYEDGVIEALQWVMGGPKPHSVQPETMRQIKETHRGLSQLAIDGWHGLLGRKS